VFNRLRAEVAASARIFFALTLNIYHLSLNYRLASDIKPGNK